MEALDELKIGTVYTVGLQADEDIENITQIVLYNRQTKQKHNATGYDGEPISYPITISNLHDVQWNATATKAMAPGVYSLQVYSGDGDGIVCVLDKECIRAKLVSESN